MFDLYFTSNFSITLLHDFYSLNSDLSISSLCSIFTAFRTTHILIRNPNKIIVNIAVIVTIIVFLISSFVFILHCSGVSASTFISSIVVFLFLTYYRFLHISSLYHIRGGPKSKKLNFCRKL